MKPPVRFGLIGAGGIGAYHRASIEANEAAGTAKLVAVADPWADRLASQKAELAARGVRWHLDYREMLRLEPDLDAVVIATPIPFHFDMAMDCLERGLAIHLEKPPVPLLCQFNKLLEADKEGRISVGFQFVGSECAQVLKQAIAAGQFGAIREIRAGGCWPRLDNYYARASWAGRMMLDGAPVFDGPATNAFAHLVNNVMLFAAAGPDDFATPVEVEGELYRARPSIESYDVAGLRGKFAGGTKFSIAVTHATELPLLFRIDILGEKGWARVTEDGGKLESNVGVECDHPQDTQELLNINHRNFVDVLTGRAPRYTTRLADTTGYVSATNAMLVSSGGIHAIPAEHAPQYQLKGETGFDVVGLREAVEETFKSGRLFSEQGLPWAVSKPQAIALPLNPADATIDFSRLMTQAD